MENKANDRSGERRTAQKKNLWEMDEVSQQ